MCVGHAKGVVNMWTPSLAEPVVKMLCHRGPVVSMAVNRAGTALVTAGLDSMVHVWDLRTYGKLHSVRTRRVAGHLDISQRGLLAIGDGTFVDVYGSGVLSAPQDDAYMSVHTGERKELVHSVRFCPFEDVLGIGRQGGFTSAIIPGSGEPNIDSFEANPFITKNQRREADVQALLDKAPPETIMLNPHDLGALDAQAVVERPVEEKVKFKPKHKSGGKDSTGLREKRKRLVSDAEFLKQRRQEVLDERQKEEQEAAAPAKPTKKKGKNDVLARFK
jgi:U3 small nucleolar RNA-associated protein 7